MGGRGDHFGSILEVWGSGSQVRLGRRFGRLLGDFKTQDGSNLMKMLSMIGTEETMDSKGGKGRSLRSRQTSLASGLGSKSYTAKN